MPTSVPQARPQPQASALRELFTRVLGWQPPRGEPATVDLDGRSHALLPLAGRHGSVALLCEPPLGEPLPDYLGRRRIRARLDRVHPRHLTIFTDSAHGEQVWTWASREPGGPLAYHERGFRRGWPADASLGVLQAITLELGEEPARLPDAWDGEHPARVLLGALLRRVGKAQPQAAGRAATAAELQQAVQDAVEGAQQPELLRAFWRGLLGLTVLDPACGTGGWLLAAMDTLTPAYSACLERMQSWTDELDRSRPRPRRERLADFRAVLARADDGRLYRCRAHFVQETILLHNLFGADTDAEAVEVCRLRFRMRLQATGAHPGARLTAGPECSLRVGDPARGFATEREVEHALPARPGAPARLRRIVEEAETGDRAMKLLRTLRLRQGIPMEEMHAGHARLQQRREAVREELDLLLAGREGVGPDRPEELRAWRERHRPLHPFLEYHGIMRRGGFVVSRGERR